jgi:hypothetical protein
MHTPLPWRNDGPQQFQRPDGKIIIEYGIVSEPTGEVVTTIHTIRGEERAKADADLIVRSCNAHGSANIPLRGGFDVGPYKGYRGRAEYDMDEGEYHGRVIETRDVITFSGRHPSELAIAFRDSVDDYLEFCTQSHHHQ